MEIDIYARWRTQTPAEIFAQHEAWSSVMGGHLGYLREAYHGEPDATAYLCAEAFGKDLEGAPIPASVLRERLPHTLELVEQWEKKLYRTDPDIIAQVKKSFSDFVALCEQKEKESGEPVRIIADQ